MTAADRGRTIAASWEANAAAWTDAVRSGRIASRRAGTDAAVVAAVRLRPPGRVLDLGCGEGWLARVLAGHGYEVTGLDGSAALVAQASALGGGDFRVASFEALVESPSLAGGPYDVVVLNFALLAEHVVPVLATAGGLLAPGGAVVLQTVHPWTAAGDGPYRDGWRIETFDAFGGAFPHAMPWYFRTLDSWLAALDAAALRLERLEEPADPETGRPLSLLLTAVPDGERRVSSR
ncbi:MAG TPA: class I SAM-dependent methyltransferase [Gemmatimonadaceae bacterium]